MINIQNEQWQLLSFPDTNIISMDIKNKSLEICVDAGYLDAPFNFLMGKGSIIFADYQTINIRSYNPELKQWFESSETLKDLCEVEFSDNVRLAGFSKKSGLWTELTLISPSFRKAIFLEIEGQELG